jgi:NADPH-dependent ferric siderophore reductase
VRPRRELPVRVHSVVEISDTVREIRLRGSALTGLRCAPGSHVVVRVPTADGAARRVYSIWRSSAVDAYAMLRIVLHSRDAPGSAWAARVQRGDPVVLEPPRSKISVDRAAAFHLFIGDETGAVPLLAMRASVRGATVAGVLECSGPGEEMPGADGAPPLPWVHRGAAPAVASKVLLGAVRGLELPTGAGVAYVAAESQTCRLVQQHLIEERGWPRSAVKVQQQWAPGRPGFGAGPI